jgi:YggT family protein
MLTQALSFVVDALFHLFILAALVRFWMQALRAPVRNPIAQFSMALTDFAVKPLRRVVPGLMGLDLATLVVAWAAEFVLQSILLLLSNAPVSGHPGVFSVVLFFAFVKLIRLSIYILMGAVLVQAVLSWMSPYHPMAPFFDALTRPFLKPLRRWVPTIGGVDVTPVFVLIACQLVIMLPVAWLELQSIKMISQVLAGG